MSARCELTGPSPTEGTIKAKMLFLRFLNKTLPFIIQKQPQKFTKFTYLNDSLIFQYLRTKKKKKTLTKTQFNISTNVKKTRSHRSIDLN